MIEDEQLLPTLSLSHTLYITCYITIKHHLTTENIEKKKKRDSTRAQTLQVVMFGPIPIIADFYLSSYCAHHV